MRSRSETQPRKGREQIDEPSTWTGSGVLNVATGIAKMEMNISDHCFKVSITGGYTGWDGWLECFVL